MDKGKESDESFSESGASELDKDYDPENQYHSDSEENIEKPSTSKKVKQVKRRESKINQDQEEAFIQACINEFDDIHDKTTKKGPHHNSKAERAKKDNVWTRIKKSMVDVLQVSKLSSVSYQYFIGFNLCYIL